MLVELQAASMPSRYRPFVHKVTVDMHEWITRVWIPHHRSLGVSRSWIESKERYSPWTRISGSRIEIRVIAFEGAKDVPVTIRATITRRGKYVNVFVDNIHSGKRQRRRRF